MNSEYDLVIIGGGVNGCRQVARDAAGRGAFGGSSCEMNDLASGTSSWSTKLVHGGLRYLEYYEFRLVREALMEREVLWAIAPHIIRPSVLRAAGIHCAACVRPGCCGSGSSSTTTSAAANCCHRPEPSTCAATSPASRWRRAASRKGFGVFRLCCRRRPARGAQRARCRRAWRRHSHAHPRRRSAAARRTLDCARSKTP